VINKVGHIIVHVSTSFDPADAAIQIDLPAAQPEQVRAQIESIFGLDPADILQISAKTGQGVESVLDAIVCQIPPPQSKLDQKLKALLFDSSSVKRLLYLKNTN
jgi:translation elongation factor EF-4